MDETTIRDLAEVQQRSKSNTRRIDAMEHQIADLQQLVATVAVIAEKQNTMEGGIEEIKEKVGLLVDKPARRWDTLITAGITAIVTGLIAYVFYRLGLGG